MRILQVINAFYPCQMWGGPPQNVYILSKGLRERGHEVQVLTTNILDRETFMSDQSFTGEWKGIPVTYLKSYWYAKAQSSLGFILSPDIFRYQHLFKWADVVHVHGYRHFFFVTAFMLAQRQHKCYVIQPRGSLPSLMGRSRMKSAFDQTIGQGILRRVGGAVSLSDEESGIMVDYGIPPEKIIKILNPFDKSICPALPDGAEFRARHGIPAHAKVALFLARLHSKKGLDLLVRAFAQLQGVDNPYLIIVGPDDGYQAPTEALIQELGIGERTKILGALYDQEKFGAFRAADVYVLPTRGVEGLPTTIVEACYAGTPIIVTKTTEVSGLIDGVAGVAIDYDLDQLVEALRGILTDDARRQRYAANTQLVLKQHFELETALDRFEAFYAAQAGIRIKG